MTEPVRSRGRYLDRLGERIRATRTVLCLGIDIEPAGLPPGWLAFAGTTLGGRTV